MIVTWDAKGSYSSAMSQKVSVKRCSGMKLLALDTSTEFLSLALWQDGASLVREVRAEQQYTQLFLPLLGELLAEAGLRLADLDAC